MEMNRSFTQILSPFTQDPDAFRSLLRETGSVISGSTALWYFMRMPTAWTPGDMDIVTPYTSFDTITTHILTLPGTTIVDEQFDDYRLLPGYYGRHRVHTPGGYIDIIQSHTPSPFTVISGYWSTHVMNALSADACWSAYPSLTIKGIGVLNFTPNGGCYTSSFDKHRQRGFSIKTADDTPISPALRHNCDTYSACPHRDRVWGDQYTMAFPLSHQSISHLMDSLTGTYTAGWRLGTYGCGNAKCMLDGEFCCHCFQWLR